jgi:peroxiredoxin
MKKGTIIYVILLILIFSLFVNYKLFVLNKHYKEKIPYLLEGEKIANVDIIGQDGQFIDPLRLKQGISVIFVFLKNCSPCDKNIIFWKKIAKLFDNKISVTGVVLNTPTEGFNFENKTKLNFKIYVPDDLPEYTRDMRMMINQSQTIVLKDGRVKMVKMGDLDGKSAVEVINLIKGLLK